MSGPARQFEHVPSHPGVYVLRGTLDLSSATLRDNNYPGQQGIAGAIAAGAYANLKWAYEWDVGDMDDIVKTANWLYNVSVLKCMTLSSNVRLNPLTRRVEPPLGLGDIEKNFVIGLTEYWVSFKFANRGYFEHESDDDNHTILVMAFAEFFNDCRENPSYGVIENDGDYFGIWKHFGTNSIFVFDPFPSRASPLPALYRIKKGACLMEFFRNLKGWRSKDMYSLYSMKVTSCRYHPPPPNYPDDGSSPVREDKDDCAMDMDVDSPCAQQSSPRSPPCSPQTPPPPPPRSPPRVPPPSPRLMRYFQQNANPNPDQQWRVNQMDCDDDDD